MMQYVSTSPLSPTPSTTSDHTPSFSSTSQGSPAAHRLFHLQILPTLAFQLRDPGLVESADKMRSKIVKEMGGETCVVV